MTLKEQMELDQSVFFNTNEFSSFAESNGVSFIVNRDDDYEVDDTKHKHFRAESQKVKTLVEGDEVLIEGVSYELMSISKVDESLGLESRLIMGLL